MTRAHLSLWSGLLLGFVAGTAQAAGSAPLGTLVNPGFDWTITHAVDSARQQDPKAQLAAAKHWIFSVNFEERDARRIGLEAEYWLKEILNGRPAEVDAKCATCRKEAAEIMGRLHPADADAWARKVVVVAPTDLASMVQRLPTATGDERLELLRDFEALRRGDWYKDKDPQVDLELALLLAGAHSQSALQRRWKRDPALALRLLERARETKDEYGQDVTLGDLRVGLLVSGAGGIARVAEGWTEMDNRSTSLDGPKRFAELLAIVKRWDPSVLRPTREEVLRSHAWQWGDVPTTLAAARSLEKHRALDSAAWAYRSLFEKDGTALVGGSTLTLTSEQKRAAREGWSRVATAWERKTGQVLPPSQWPPPSAE